jgi:hypothetical protein
MTRIILDQKEIKPSAGPSLLAVKQKIAPVPTKTLINDLAS